MVPGFLQTYTLNYTLADADGDTSAAALSVAIQGSADTATVTTSAAGAAPDASVQEAGLNPNGSNAPSATETTAGSFSISASDGITSLVVGGQTLSLAQLNALASTPQSISTDLGTLTLTAFSSGSVSYTYTLNNTVDNDSRSGATPAHFDDSLSITVNGLGGSSATDNLVIRIVDDLPQAHPDTNSAIEHGPEVSGNVKQAIASGDASDEAGADGGIQVTSAAQEGSVITLGSPSATTNGGVITLNADGSYTYKPPTWDRVPASGVREVIAYTITDADGDTSTTTLTISVANDARSVVVDPVTVNEGSDFVIFTLTATPGQDIALNLAEGVGTGQADIAETQPLEIWDGSGWAAYTQGTTHTVAPDGKILVRASIRQEQDRVYEARETFQLRAHFVDNPNIASAGVATIVDDGTGARFTDSPPNPDGTPPEDRLAVRDDDRPVFVNQISVSEASPFAVFTVTAQPGQLLRLALQSDTALVGTDTSTALQYFDGAIWVDYTPGSFIAVPAASPRLLVRVAITNDATFEGSETIRLIATNTGGASGTGLATITDDGSNGLVFDADNTTGRATNGIADDDQPKPPPQTATPTPAPVIAEPVATPAPTPAPAPVQPFNSATVVTAPSTLPLSPRPAIGEILTSSTGFRATVIESPEPALILFRGITDQFVEGNQQTTFALPADAFAHTRAEAVLTLTARLTDGRPLPGWVVFDAQAGVFRATPPTGFRGELEIQVSARDNDGREATANFRFFVGDAKPATQGRNSLSEQIRLAAKRPNPWLDGTDKPQRIKPFPNARVVNAALPLSGRS